MLEYPFDPVAVHEPVPPRQHYKTKGSHKKGDYSAREPPQTQRQGNPRFSVKSARARRPFRAMSPVVQNGPISPNEALSRYSLFLTPFEMDEIQSFPEIYYVGQANRKIIPNDDDPFNYGFDNDSNNYNLIAGDHLAYRYEILSLFGAGAFGQVVRCFDHKLKCQVAIKVIVNTEQMHEQGRIEAQILSRLNKAEVRHVVRAYDFFIFRSHICITFEVLSKNLYEVVEQNNFKPLPLKLVRLYALQILSALDQAHRLNVVHCDLKPENVLLVKGSNSIVKLIDFGSSCFVDQQIYEYIQSRFYRAPEVIIGIPYGPPMDIWSFSLIIIELLLGVPLFPGDTEAEVLSMMTALIGPPPKELVAVGKRKEEFFDDDCNLRADLLQTVREPFSTNLKQMIKEKEPNAKDGELDMIMDFLMKCMTWDQTKRITANQALQHPWIRSKEIVVQKKPSSTLPLLSQ